MKKKANILQGTNPQHSVCKSVAQLLGFAAQTMQFQTYKYITVVELGAYVQNYNSICHEANAYPDPNPNILAAVWPSFSA